MRRLLKKFKHHVLWALNKLPFNLFAIYMRNNFYVSPLKGRNKEVVFKLAKTKAELEMAFELVQEAYLESNLSNDHSKVMRVLKYNLLPTTKVFIAVYRGEVVATVSHIIDSEFGLPIESVMNVSEFRESGKRFCEISGLAVKRGWRSNTRGIFFPLVFSAAKYSIEVLGVENFLTVTNFSGSVYYRNILMMSPLILMNKKYSNANNNEAYGQYLNKVAFERRIKKYYFSSQIYCNVHLLWNIFPYKKNCDFSFEKKRTVNLLSAKEQNEHLLFMKENIVQFDDVLTYKEKTHLLNTYHIKVEVKDNNGICNRKDNRYLVNFKMKFLVDRKVVFAQVLDISISGFTIVTEVNSQLNDMIIGKFCLDDINEITVKAKLMWTSGNKAGYMITLIDRKKWSAVIKNIEDEFECYKTAA